MLVELNNMNEDDRKFSLSWTSSKWTKIGPSLKQKHFLIIKSCEIIQYEHVYGVGDAIIELLQLDRWKKW